MKKETCEHCACLVEGLDGEWICDEVGKHIIHVDVCCEGMEDSDEKN